ncbi:cysteine-rich receptor-like protein kinase 8 [Tanacetum coccineum]
MVIATSFSSPTSDLNNQALLLQNPLFLHPSNGPDNLVVHEKLIGAQNYRSWKRGVEIALSTKRKLGFIRGAVPRSADDASLQEQWDTCNNLVISWLMNSASESIAKSIMFIGTAHGIWLQLETRFALSNGSHKYKLNRQTYDTTQSGKSVREYYTAMKCVWEELDSMNELPRIINITPEIVIFLNALNTQNEEQRLFQFLNGLDDHFSTQRSQLLMNSPLPSVKTACALLQQEDVSKNVDICCFQMAPPKSLEKSLGYPLGITRTSKIKKQKEDKRVILDKSTAAFAENGGHVVFTFKKFEQLMKSIPHFNQTGETPEIDHPFGEGASDHMSPDSDDLDNVFELKNKQVINLPNGHTSVISKVGNMDVQTRKVLGLGKKKAGLYHLLNLPLDQIHVQLSSMVVYALEDCSLYSFFSNCSMPNNFAFSVFNNKYSLWHHRLGHVLNTTLKHITSISDCVSKPVNDTCLTCPMAKFTKLPYPVSESHSEVPFHPIHIDIWGPYKISTIRHHKYFLTIVDDCSREIWTYLLVQKSEAFTIFKSFITFVKTQFGKDIKVVRSNNALEFLKGSLGPFMESLGIEHQTSCVDRPQQNGKVERRHRNIIEIARALRLHAHLPVHYWGDCVITATYLINRFPTAVLNYKTPYEVLLNFKPVYDHLRVFGCLAVASNPLRVADKFEARGVTCVFLGYPQHQKGYKLLNLLNHTRFVSRDVVFHERIFPYSKDSMRQILQPIPAPVSSPVWYEEFTSTT